MVNPFYVLHVAVYRKGGKGVDAAVHSGTIRVCHIA